MSYDEVKRLLQMINIDLSEQYARSLFKVSVITGALNYPLAFLFSRFKMCELGSLCSITSRPHLHLLPQQTKTQLFLYCGGLLPAVSLSSLLQTSCWS